MAMPKTTQTRYMDGSVQRTTQVTPSLHHSSVIRTKLFPVISQKPITIRSEAGSDNLSITLESNPSVVGIIA